jgi:hypothetical protein
MVAAGASWGLAFGCRGSAALPVPLLVVLTALAASPPHGGRRSWLAPLRAAALAAAPVAAAVAAFLLYNKLRFQSWLDFGLSKQLTTTPFRTDPSYFWPNLYSYLLRPLQRSCKFPFMSALPNDGHYPHWLVSPAAYARREPIAGLMATTPWIWFGAIAVFVLGRAVLRGWRDRGASLAIDRDARLRLWCALSFLTLGTTTGLPVITEFFASMRFVGDVAAGLVLLSIWGAWTLYQAVINRPWLRRATATAIVLAASVTVVTGLLLGFEGYERSFETGNPALFEHLSRALSICGR